MRFFLVAAMILPLAVQAVQAASPLPGKTIKIKDEILNNCGNFPYAPTLAMDAKTATLEDMKRKLAGRPHLCPCYSTWYTRLD